MRIRLRNLFNKYNYLLSSDYLHPIIENATTFYDFDSNENRNTDHLEYVQFPHNLKSRKTYISPSCIIMT